MGSRGPVSAVEQLTIQRSSSATRKLPARGRPRNPPTVRKPAKPETIAPPPKHLNSETKAWWKMIATAYELEEHQYRVLLLACETLDRRQDARAALKKHGMVYTDDKGVVRQRPEVCIERDSAAAFLRALRALRLENEAL
jgi:P27 family predicted phage terminase small subunit